MFHFLPHFQSFMQPKLAPNSLYYIARNDLELLDPFAFSSQVKLQYRPVFAVLRIEPKALSC